MASEMILEFYQQLLQGLHISSCIVTNPSKAIPVQIDLGLRRNLYGAEDYSQYFANDFSQARSHTIYCFFDAFDCKYIFLELPSDPSAYFFIGPYLLQMPDRQWLKQQGQTLGLSDGQQQQMELYYAGLPIVEDENLLLTMTTTLAVRLWGEETAYAMEYVQYQIPDHRKPYPADQSFRNMADTELDLTTLEQNYAAEKVLMDAVSKGQLHLLSAAATVYNTGAQPRLTDSLRNRKNYLIILKTLLRKAAEYGGVHPLHIHKLSARYAELIEGVRTMKESLRLQEEMIRRYCLLVKQHSLSKYSYYVGQVITLVQYDLSADLRLKTIAGKLNVNASYLSDLFHREYGCTLTEFVTRERIAHSIHLLQTTQRSIQQIAAECGFQETAYFIKLFKKATSLTPNAYREHLVNVPHHNRQSTLGQEQTDES